MNLHTYDLVKWENAPSKATPLSAENLNHMDLGIAAVYKDVEALAEEIEKGEGGGDSGSKDASDMTVTFDESGKSELQPSGSTLKDIIEGIHGKVKEIEGEGTPATIPSVNNLGTTKRGYVLDARAGHKMAAMVAPFEDMADGDDEVLSAAIDPTATRAYQIGDLFILYDKLYRVTASIAVGDTIAVGENCEETTISGVLPKGVERILTKRYTVTLNINDNFASYSITLPDGIANGYLFTAVDDMWPITTWIDADARLVRATLSENVLTLIFTSTAKQQYTIGILVAYKSLESLDRVPSDTIETWETTEFQSATGHLWAHKCGRIVWAHGYHYLNDGTQKETKIVTLPWAPLSAFNVSTQNDAAGLNASGFLDILATGDILVGTTWSGNVRYTFTYFTND